MFVSRLGDCDIFLDAEPDVFVFDVNSDIDREYHTGCDGVSFWADVVNVQSDMMSARVPVVFADIFVFTKVSGGD